MSPNIRCISSNTIRPATPTEATVRIDLTPWDLITLPHQYIQMGLLFLKPQIPEQESTLINHLTTSFSRTLDYFLPLTGRLATETHQEDNTTSFYLDCKVVGALFVHATADVTISDIVDPLYISPIVPSFFPLNGVMNHEGQIQPLLGVQVTQLIDGVFIGCCMNHVIGDGTSFWHFMNSWSAISRSLDHVPRLPVFDRWFQNDTDLPVRFQPSIHEVLKQPYSPAVLSERVFHFTPQKIAEIKTKANKEQESTDVPISTLQALLGHAWITITRARNLDPNEIVIYGMAAGNRSRLDPPLPEEYFGNSIQSLVVITKSGELLEKGLGYAARLLNQEVRSHNNEKIRNYFDACIKKPELLYPPSQYPPNIVATGCSPRFELYGNDFGWGRPIAMRMVNMIDMDGTVTVHQGAVKGSLDVHVTLEPQLMKSIDACSEFTQVVSI